MNRYQALANETADRISNLHRMIAKFSAHPTLHTRVAGIRAELATRERELKNLEATSRWAAELKLSGRVY